MTKKILVSSLLLFSASAFSLVAINAMTMSGQSFFSTLADHSFALALNSSTAINGLTSTYSSGSFVTKTTNGNNIHWDYNYAKTNESGFITLGRKTIGNSTGEEGYIQNVDPITSLSSIDIVYSGTDGYLTFYGSIDGINFERVTTIDGSSSITELNHYFYVKIASGERNKADLNITSITFSYDCSASDYTPEFRDEISGVAFDTDSSTSLKSGEIDTTYVFDAARSTQSIRWTNNLSSKYRYAKFYLNNEYTAENLAKYNLVFYVYVAEGTTLSDSSSSGTTIILDFFHNSDQYSGQTAYPWFSLSKTSTWTKVTYDLSSRELTGNLNRLRIAVNNIITAGGIYFDDFHLEEKNEYPTFNYDYTASTDEKDDLINEGIENASSSTTGEFSYSDISSKGDRSLKIYMSNDYAFANLSATYNVDLAGKIVTFDYKTDSSGYIYFAFYSDDNGTETYYYEDISKTRTGSTVTNITGLDGETWKHVVFDVDAVKNGGHVSKKTGSSNSSYQGIRHTETGRTTYIDNLYVVGA